MQSYTRTPFNRKLLLLHHGQDHSDDTPSPKSLEPRCVQDKQQYMKQTSGIEVKFMLEHATHYTKLCEGLSCCAHDTAASVCIIAMMLTNSMLL